MSWSLGEIESLSRKATRGAGYLWGHAEEAGKAVRWLCAAGLPGETALSGLLQHNDGQPYEQIRPVDTSAMPWQARGGALCPLASGAALCDLAEPGFDAALARVGFPLLLLPYVVIAADMTKAPLRVVWQGVTITRNAQGTYMQAAPDALNPIEAQMLRVSPAPDHAGTRLRRSYRAEIDAPSAEILAKFAHRTYAPETEESRLSGAGAGLTDND